MFDIRIFTISVEYSISSTVDTCNIAFSINYDIRQALAKMMFTVVN